MKIFSIDEFLTFSQYEPLRKDKLISIVKLKRNRRIDYGDRFTFLFENRETIKHQIQEVIYMDMIEDPEEIEEVIKTYEPIVPGRNELTLTVFINIYNDKELREVLPKYRGIDTSISLEIDGRIINGEPVFPEKSSKTTCSIHYIKFKMDHETISAIKGGADVFISVRHPQAMFKVRLPEAVLKAISQDL